MRISYDTILRQINFVKKSKCFYENIIHIYKKMNIDIQYETENIYWKLF